MKTILLSAFCALLIGVSSPALAQDCCQRCQQKCCCESCCHLVCEMKPVKKTTYTCECEDFCIPGPSKRCLNCDSDDCAKDCKGDDCCHKKYSWIPTCAKLCHRKKLVKHEETVMQPTYKWVTETLCPKCAKGCVTHE